MTTSGQLRWCGRRGHSPATNCISLAVLAVVAAAAVAYLSLATPSRASGASFLAQNASGRRLHPSMASRQIPHHIPARWLPERQFGDTDQDWTAGGVSQSRQAPAATTIPTSSSSSSAAAASAAAAAAAATTTTTTITTTTVGSAATNRGGHAFGQSRQRRSEDVCADRLCYGLPMGCLDRAPASPCSVLVTSKRLIDPYRPVARDIHFELVALPLDARSNYAAVGFSETGRMAGLVTECLQYRDPVTQLQVIKLAHSYNIPGAYSNVPATILSGIKNLGVSYENGYYQCRWVVESAVEFTYEDPTNGSLVNRREDLGYRNYHILLAVGAYDEKTNEKRIHTERVSSMAPISLAQTGLIKSLGAHILVRIHGCLMVTIWLGLVTISIILARYYKNEWANSKINDLAIWFVLHRALMLIAWFGSVIAVIFAYMYTETYHPGVHQVAGTTCLVLSTIQVLGGLLRPSIESNKRAYFNWTHFACGNLSYLFAMVSIVTAAFLAPAHLPPLYIWVVVAFVALYALTHLLLTIHQYIVHKSSKISITPSKGDLSGVNGGGLEAGQYMRDSYPFRQVMLGILVATVIFIVLLLLWTIAIRAT